MRVDAFEDLVLSVVLASISRSRNGHKTQHVDHRKLWWIDYQYMIRVQDQAEHRL